METVGRLQASRYGGGGVIGVSMASGLVCRVRASRRVSKSSNIEGRNINLAIYPYYSKITILTSVLGICFNMVVGSRTMIFVSRLVFLLSLLCSAAHALSRTIRPRTGLTSCATLPGRCGCRDRRRSTV